MPRISVNTATATIHLRNVFSVTPITPFHRKGSRHGGR